MVSSLFRAQSRTAQSSDSIPFSGARFSLGNVMHAQMLPWLHRSPGTIGVFACIWGESQMKLAFQLIACWLVFSCVVGPIFSWAFFRGERLARDQPGPVDTAATQNFADATR
jgi:hypothetical protein